MDVTEVINITKPSRSRGYEDEDDDSDIEMLGNNHNDGEFTNNNSSIVTPGELITEDPIWMKGHGTYFIEDKTYSSVAGNVSRVNRLLSVIPIRGRYQPETGDHIVGRITEVGNKRWKVDIGAKQDAVLMLGSVNLPGGILRRKSETDELQMRNFLKEGDLLNAEVQTIFNNGIASLHTRSLKYGKLRNGMFLKVPSSLIIKSKNHAFDLPGNISCVLGVNGYIWLYKTNLNNQNNNTTNINIHNNGASPAITRLEEESSWEIYSDKNDSNITNAIRSNITRYYNIIKALSFCELGITEPRIIMGYESSLSYMNVGSLIDKDSMETICQEIINNEKMRG
ncbi:hypothetical protein DFJ63DRAFT_27555 [Scheffersomyces coipomensis]|uniref:uncharacterized protein n=1 Tax=Scheffersomyces coipomensis TaxID=1788519 RepID=UPI00315DEEB0